MDSNVCVTIPSRTADSLPQLDESESPPTQTIKRGGAGAVNPGSPPLLPDSPSRSGKRSSLIQAWRARESGDRPLASLDDKPRNRFLLRSNSGVGEVLQLEAEELRQTNTQLQGEVAALQSQLDSLRDEGRSLRSQFTVVETSKSVTNKVLQDLTKQVLGLKARNTELEGHLEQSAREVEEALSKRDDEAEKAFESRAQKLAEQVDDMKGLCDSLRKQLADLQLENKALKVQEAERAKSNALLLQDLLGSRRAYVCLVQQSEENIEAARIGAEQRHTQELLARQLEYDGRMSALAEEHQTEKDRLRGEMESLRIADEAATHTLSTALEDTKRLMAEQKKKSDTLCLNLANSLKDKNDLILQQQAHCIKLEAELAKQLEVQKLVIRPVTVDQVPSGPRRRRGIRHAIRQVPVWLVKTGFTVAATLAANHEVHKRQLFLADVDVAK